ncbi:MAG: HAMP domain-containing protein [Deltaproteobacteria bacterium]|nr:HAMP domain-containing protein [Deltaproteobacteria bacterium]
MKKKVFIALLVLVFCFFSGGIYIARSIDEVITGLENVITLHQVEFLRKDLQNKISVVQTDLLLKDSPHALPIDLFMAHATEMEKAAHVCITCHHTDEVLKTLYHFQDQIDRYMQMLSRVYTIRGEKERVDQEKNGAFAQGEAALAEVEKIVITSSEKISNRITLARNNIAETEHLLFFLISAGPLFLILIAYVFLNKFTTSVEALVDATRKIQQGDLRYRVQEKLPDEFAMLASAFNEMANSLKDQCQHMQQTERLAVVGELAVGLAHEVKNPLAGIKVSIEVLANELTLEQEDKEVFLRIINEIHRIESLLKSLLSYARPSGPAPVSLDLHQLLDTTIKSAGYSLVNPANAAKPLKEIEIVKNFSPEVPHVVADQGQMQQVFLNLMLNAIDAIPAKGVITITTQKESNAATQIIIADTGKGISPENLSKIFNPFFTTKPKGTGLGLAICKRLIELHNGTIHVSSTPGEGTTFYITLPEKQQLQGVSQ